MNVQRIHQAIDIAYDAGFYANSMVMRKARWTFSEAVEMGELLEAEGIAASAVGSKARVLLVTRRLAHDLIDDHPS